MPQFQQHDEASAQQQTRLGLIRSTAAVVVLLVLTALLATAASYFSTRNRALADQARDRLHDSLVAQARAESSGHRLGSRQSALDAIAAAAAIRPTDQLRDHAILNLTRTDLVVESEWTVEHDLTFAAQVAFSPDFRRYALASGRTILICPPGSGTPRRQFEVQNAVARIAFSPTPDELVIYQTNGETIFHDLRTNTPRLVIPFPTDNPGDNAQATNIALSPDGAQLVVAAEDADAIYVIDTIDGHTIRHQADIPGLYAAAAGPRGSYAIGSGSSILWYHDPGAPPTRYETPEPVSRIAVSADRSRIVYTGGQGAAGIIDTITGKTTTTPGLDKFVDQLLLSPDGEIFVASSWSGLMRVFEVRTGKLLLEDLEAEAIAFCADSSHLGFIRSSNAIGIWGVRRSPVHSVISTHQAGFPRTIDLDISPDGKLVSASDSGESAAWDRYSGQLLTNPVDFYIGGSKFTGTPGNSVLASSRIYSVPHSYSDGTLTFGTPTPYNVPAVEIYGAPQCVPGSRHLFSVIGSDPAAGSGVVIDSHDPGAPPLARVTGAPAEHKQGKFVVSPDVRYGVFSLWHNRTTQIWDLHENSMTRELLPFGGDAEFSADGRLLVAATHAAYHIYQTGTWQELAKLDRRTPNTVFASVAISPDSRYAAINKTRQLAQLIDLRDFSVAASLQLADPSITSDFVFADDGETLAAAQSGRIVLWDLPALRDSLTSLGLSFGTAPSTTPPSNTPSTLIIAAGVVAALVFGLVILRYQKHLVARLDAQYAEIQRTRDQFVQGEKMKALGTLSAGIAHDFRNLLSVIGLSNGLLKRAVGSDPDLAEETDAIARAVDQGDKVVRSMLGFTRTSTDDTSPAVDVADLIENTAAMLGQHFLSGIRLTLEISPDLPHAQVPRPQLEQALLNLVVNAADAMHGHGTLTLTAIPIDPAHLPPDAVLAPRPATTYIAITVTDTGPGIAADILPQVFDPFFTTKHQGATPGTGLGLSTVHASCSRTGTGIHVACPDTGGTTVTLLVPA